MMSNETKLDSQKSTHAPSETKRSKFKDAVPPDFTISSVFREIQARPSPDRIDFATLCPTLNDQIISTAPRPNVETKTISEVMEEIETGLINRSDPAPKL